MNFMYEHMNHSESVNVKEKLKMRESKMNKRYGLAVAMLPLLLSTIYCTGSEQEMPVATCYKAVTEISEGPIRRGHIEKPIAGAK